MLCYGVLLVVAVKSRSEVVSAPRAMRCTFVVAVASFVDEADLSLNHFICHLHYIVPPRILARFFLTDSLCGAILLVIGFERKRYVLVACR